MNSAQQKTPKAWRNYKAWHAHPARDSKASQPHSTRDSRAGRPCHCLSAIMRGMKTLTVLLFSLTLCISVVAQGGNGTIDYSAPPNAPFTAEEVTIQAKGYTLAGTLLLPKSAKRPLPAVITITGSGIQTRDEPLPIPGLEKYRPMRQIAETLASRGIAVLRVDDRGSGGSGGRETLATATTSSFADDTRAEVAYLRSRSEIDPKRIALAGHSE